MSEAPHPLRGPLLEPGYRGSGLLLHVTSLPSPYGIGDFGSAAMAWVDRLHAAEQGWWQGLPLGPTGYGNSPYQSPSSFAGHPLLISFDSLVRDGLVTPGDLKMLPEFRDDRVDFDAVIEVRTAFLKNAARKFTRQCEVSPLLHRAFESF